MKKKKKQRERAEEKKERMSVLDDLLEHVWRKEKERVVIEITTCVEETA